MERPAYCYNCMEPLPAANAPDAPCPSCGHVGPVSSAPHQLSPGTLLQGRYLLGRVLGQGGFGITYLGRDLERDERIAVKEYFPTGFANRSVATSDDVIMARGDVPTSIANGKSRFLDEARALARLGAIDGVVDVRGFFEENGTAYMLMEYLEGEDLEEYLRHRLLGVEETFARMAPIMDALAAAHAEGLVHRDINPGNIKVLGDGSFKLIDFGAARFVTCRGSRPISVILKPGYAPEEQYSERGVQGPWTDIYSLCATFYTCITGLTPPDAIARITEDEDPIKWPSELGVSIGERQERVLKKGMAVRRRDRFQSVRELERTLRSVREDDASTQGKDE